MTIVKLVRQVRPFHTRVVEVTDAYDRVVARDKEWHTLGFSPPEELGECELLFFEWDDVNKPLDANHRPTADGYCKVTWKVTIPE